MASRARADAASSASAGASPRGGSTQRLVRATLARVGGYWRPLAAVARLLEELGELAEILQSSAQEPEELAAELADLWIITTAVADQFLGEVREPGSHPTGEHGNPDRGELAARRAGDQLAPLVVAAAQIARIVNYYDGPKTPRSLDGWPSLNDAVATFQLALAAFARATAIELSAAVADKLRFISSRDANRFAPAEHDPSTAPCLELFRRIETTPWGEDIGRARLWGAPAWAARSPTANAVALIPTLRAFARAASRERLEGYVIAGPELESVELAEAWSRAVLRELAGEERLLAGEPLVFGDQPLSASLFPAPHPHILLRPGVVEDAGEHR